MANLFTSPAGTITGFCAIEKPSTKFDQDGTYSCKVEFTGDSAIEFKSVIDELMEDSLFASGKTKAANPPYTFDGSLLTVNFKTKAKITCRDGSVIEKTIKLYDSQAQVVNQPLGIGAGSVVKIQFSPYSWSVASAGAGVTLQPIAIQVIKLEKFSGGGASAFAPVDGGFTAAVINGDELHNMPTSTGSDVPF